MREVQINQINILKQCAKLVEDAGIFEPPVDLKLLASFRDIRRIESCHMLEAGMLIPLKNGGLHVKLRATDSVERRNFSLAHEIVHTFFPEFLLKPQKRIDQEIGIYSSKDQTEYLCDLGASYLLMPQFIFEPQFMKLGFSLNSLFSLSSSFKSSLEATGLRMASQNVNEYAFVIWERKLKKSETNKNQEFLFQNLRPEKKIRVKSSFGLSGLGYIPKDKSLDEIDGGLISSAFESECAQEGVESISFGDFSAKLHIEAICVPFNGNKRVLSLMRCL